MQPGIMIGISSCGFTSNPNVKNMINWLNHDKPSKKRIVVRLCMNLEFPITKPPM